MAAEYPYQQSAPALNTTESTTQEPVVVGAVVVEPLVVLHAL